MKISKKVGIAVFWLAGACMTAVILIHQNRGPEANYQEELRLSYFFQMVRQVCHPSGGTVSEQASDLETGEKRF